MNKLPVLAEFDYNKIGSFRNGNPYTIAYCYTSEKYHRFPAFIIKGGAKDVDHHIKYLGFPMVVWKTFWRFSRSRNLTPSFENFKDWSASGQMPWIMPENRRIDKRIPRYYYRNWTIKFLGRTWMKFRRFPRKWLPEYEEMLSARRPT